MNAIINNRAARLLAAALSLSMGISFTSNAFSQAFPGDVTPAPVAPQGSAITMDTVCKMLTSEGIKFQKADADHLTIEFEADDGLTYSIGVCISTNGRFIWFYTCLEQVRPGSLSPKEMASLLTANHDLGESNFVLSGQNLELNMAIRNLGVTADELASDLKNYEGDLTWSTHLWYVAPEATTNPAPGT